MTTTFFLDKERLLKNCQFRLATSKPTGTWDPSSLQLQLILAELASNEEKIGLE